MLVLFIIFAKNFILQKIIFKNETNYYVKFLWSYSEIIKVADRIDVDTNITPSGCGIKIGTSWYISEKKEISKLPVNPGRSEKVRVNKDIYVTAIIDELPVYENICVSQSYIHTIENMIQNISSIDHK